MLRRVMAGRRGGGAMSDDIQLEIASEVKAIAPAVDRIVSRIRSGLWLPGKGYFVSVNASTKVCTKPEAAKLAPQMK